MSRHRAAGSIWTPQQGNATNQCCWIWKTHHAVPANIQYLNITEPLAQEEQKQFLAVVKLVSGAILSIVLLLGESACVTTQSYTRSPPHCTVLEHRLQRLFSYHKTTQDAFPCLTRVSGPRWIFVQKKLHLPFLSTTFQCSHSRTGVCCTACDPSTPSTFPTGRSNKCTAALTFICNSLHFPSSLPAA